jgi:hypothetical protein
MLSPPSASQGLIPIANAIGKDLMLDVSPQLHPSTLVGESAKQIKFQHWIDNDIHCEDCLRLEIPNNGKTAGVAFSSNGAVYNFEEAKKIRFYVMGEVSGAKVNFKAVGNDKGNNAGGNPTDNKAGIGGSGKNSSSNNKDLFTNQEFAVSSQNVTLNQTWNYHEMNLDGAQQKLGKVKYPFGLEVAQGKGSAAVTIIYLKGITYSSEPVQEKYLLEPSSANTTATSLPITAAARTPARSLNITLQDNATETVNAPATVAFNATVTNGQEPYSFDWDFKDRDPRQTDTDDSSVAHTFTTPGLYNVTVNVRDSGNSTGSAAALVEVVEDDDNDGAIEDQPQTGVEGNSTQGLQVTNNASNNTNDSVASAPVADNNDDNQTEQERGEAEQAEAEDDTKSGDRSTGAAEDEQPVNQNGGGDVDTGDDGSINDTGTNNTDTNTRPGTDADSNSRESNSPPVADAGKDITGVPNGQIILDASKSSDPDAGDTIISYLWEQESGPTVEINDQTSPTPKVTLPNIDEDATVVFSLTVNDGTTDSEDEDSVSIFIDYVKPLPNNIQQGALKPSDIITSQWTQSGGCQEDTRCLSDGSHATFLTATTDDTDKVNLYSFGEFTVGRGANGAGIDRNSVVIDRVVAEISAKKLGNTGYVSFAVDDPTEEDHYFTPSISISSNSFQRYYQVWDMNPVNGERWTYDSLNSLVAGFKYDGGQSGVEISELQLTVSYHLQAPQATDHSVDQSVEADPALTNDQGDTQPVAAGEGAEDGHDNDENGTDSVQGAEEETESDDGEPEQTDQEGDEPMTQSDRTDSATAEEAGANATDDDE